MKYILAELFALIVTKVDDGGLRVGRLNWGWNSI